MMTFLSPLLVWGMLLGADPPHHPPAEPPPVPPGGMGADALPEADDPAEPAADPDRAAAPAAAADRAAGAAVLLPGPAGAQPDGPGTLAGRRRAVEPGRAGRRLAEHGLRRRRRRRRSSGPGRPPAALLAAARPQDRCTLVDDLGPAVAGASTRSRGRAATSSRARRWPCRSTATHAAWPSVLEGVDEVLQSCTYPTRQLTIVTDLRKAGWDGGVAADRPALGRAGGPRPASWTSATTRPRNVALESLVPLDRTILAGAESRWEAVIRNDSPRVLDRRQGDPPGRRPADRGDAARDPAAADRPGAADRPVPGRRACTTSRSSSPTTSCPATTSAGRPSR